MVSVAKKKAPKSIDSEIDYGPKMESEPSVDFYQLAVKDLMLNQLRLLHVSAF